MEVIALRILSVISIIVYGVVAAICFHTLVKLRSSLLFESFLSLAGLSSLAVIALYTLSLLGLLPLPLPPLVIGYIIPGVGSFVGLGAWIIRDKFTRPK